MGLSDSPNIQTKHGLLQEPATACSAAANSFDRSFDGVPAKRKKTDTEKINSCSAAQSAVLTNERGGKYPFRAETYSGDERSSLRGQLCKKPEIT
jgi:hypothetical protein